MPSTAVRGVGSWGHTRGLVTLALALVAFLVVVMPWAKDRLNVEVDAAFVSIGSRMTIPVRFYVDTDAHRITAPAISVQRAELVDTHGSLRFPAPKGYFLYVNAAFLVALLMLALFGLQQLHAVFATLRRGNHSFTQCEPAPSRPGTVIARGAGGVCGASTFLRQSALHATGIAVRLELQLDFFAIVVGLITSPLLKSSPRALASMKTRRSPSDAMAIRVKLDYLLLDRQMT